MMTKISGVIKNGWTALALSVGTFLAITLANIHNASIWFDEAFSAYIIRFNYWEIANFTATDVHPPMYYWALKTWTLLFGTGEFGVRSFSVFMGVLAIIFAYLLVNKMFGKTIASLSVGLLSISPLLVRYSDETRMYTMAAATVMVATLVLLKATETGKRKWWMIYGVLVSLGMWTHYFTALVWLAHWVWRASSVPRVRSLKKWLKSFFTKDWILAHVLAVGLFLPWIPFFVTQTGSVQAGFWIGDVGVDTINNYFTNFFYYLEHDQVHNWWAVLLVTSLIIIGLLSRKAYKNMKKSQRNYYILIICLSFVPPVLLYLLSLPPLSSVFVERYLVPSAVALTILIAITVVIGTKGWRFIFKAMLVVMIATMMIFGVTNVYKYGNFNKNSNTHILTREVVEMINEESEPGIPIISKGPWVYYEAVFYSNDDHPIYFIDEATDYAYGSLDMLKKSDINKIINLDEFLKENPVIWYIGGTSDEDVEPLDESWQKIRTVSAYDWITGNTYYKATEYRVSEE